MPFSEQQAAMLEGVDFSAYLDSALLADVEVSIIIDDRPKPDAAVTTPRSRPAPAPAAITLPGHRLVLHAASPLFAGHIERWNKGQKEGGAASTGRRFGLDGAGDGSRPVRARIQLLVENEEEAEAAQLLYRAIYSGQKALAGASFAQLITVARLAHGFGVQRCAEMAASQLASATADDLSWDMVEAVFAIPSPCSQLPAFAPLLAAARGRLQAELGDLEATMRDESARGRLMALPLATLTALLSEGATRAACEATVLAVASSWFAEAFADEARQPPGAKEQAAQALAGCVRFARLPPAVLAAVAPRTEWVAAAVGLQQLLDLAAFAAAGAEGQKVMLEDKHGLVATHPHWFRPQRPPSAVAGAAFDVKVTAEELRVAAVKARAECKPGGRVYVRPCPPVFYIGFSWRPQIEVMLCPDGGVLYGLYLHCVDQKLFTPHHAQNVPCTLIMAAEGRAAVVTTDAIAPRVGSGRGYKDFWGLGVQPGWDSEAWAQRGLLQEDGTVCVNISLGLPSSA